MTAVLQASFGDRLHAFGLASEMTLVRDGRAISPSRGALREGFPRASRNIALWVHGLGTTEAVWERPGRKRLTFASLLERDARFTSVFLRYNTGRSIRANGESADLLLEQLVAAWPVRPSTITLIGYSMGGLVVRSALEHGAARSAPWVPLVRRTVHLGVPHLGAPLERAGRVTTSFLKAFPNPWTKLVGAVADLRSAGVKDLAAGDIVPDGAWVPLPRTGTHHAIVGTLHTDPLHVLSWLLGDGLVPIASARARIHGGTPGFPPENVTLVGGVGHLALPRSPRVYPAILTALTGRIPRPAARRRQRP